MQLKPQLKRGLETQIFHSHIIDGLFKATLYYIYIDDLGNFVCAPVFQ